ncbi:hypothetical protein E5161_11725 [Cohnella pontilimi]|uniref:LppX_LprAFG lipoprotein n=1 Tax=Cohnella pontilimi TaxID=2564100 RepID=A0A4U0FAT9_9BACL|nr:DUF6612 family protein [Cohnella pontilimi]TJY41865.1 hypothetical protein E5161_11725 [Cohnella pontilimi]
MKAYFVAGTHRIRRLSAAALALAAAIILASCSNSAKPQETASSAPPPSPSKAELTAADLLDQAEAAAQQMKKYAFELELIQHLSGEGEEGNSSVNVNMKGRAELGPLKLDQTIKSDIDGEESSIRSILVPEAYYMYDPEFEEWSKLSASQTSDIMKTLSDLQVNPAQSILDIRALGAGLQAKPQGDTFTIRYDGAGVEARTFLDKILESTLDLSGMDPKVRNSIKLDSMQVELLLDAARKWPISYRIDSVMSVEYVKGKPSTLEQSISGSYSQHNASEGIVVPEEAKNAPELDPAPMD